MLVLQCFLKGGQTENRNSGKIRFFFKKTAYFLFFNKEKSVEKSMRNQNCKVFKRRTCKSFIFHDFFPDFHIFSIEKSTLFPKNKKQKILVK